MTNLERRDEIVKDLRFILNNREQLSERSCRKILDNLIWSWTEVDGKIRGCVYRSVDAINKYRDNDWLLKGLKFQHEHAIPRKILVEWLNKFEATTLDELRNFLEVCVIGVVVSNDDHIILHEADRKIDWAWDQGISFEKTFSRYKLAGIDIAKVRWGHRRAPEKISYIYFNGGKN